MQMSGYTKGEALAFIDAIRLNLEGKVGFKWLVARLSNLAAYVESIAADNERMNAYLEWAGARDDYESYCATHADDAFQEDADDD